MSIERTRPAMKPHFETPLDAARYHLANGDTDSALRAILEYLDSSSREAGRAGEGDLTQLIFNWCTEHAPIDGYVSASDCEELSRRIASALRTAGRGKDSTESQPATGDGTGDKPGARGMYEYAMRDVYGDSSINKSWEQLDADTERQEWISAYRFARDMGRREVTDAWSRESAEKRELEEKLSAAEARAEKAESAREEAERKVRAWEPVVRACEQGAAHVSTVGERVVNLFSALPAELRPKEGAST